MAFQGIPFDVDWAALPQEIEETVHAVRDFSDLIHSGKRVIVTELPKESFQSIEYFFDASLNSLEHLFSSERYYFSALKFVCSFPLFDMFVLPLHEQGF